MARNIRGYVKRLQEPEGHGDYWKGYNSALNDILSFIDSMDEEPVGGELEEAANAYISNENNYTHSRTDTFKAGAEWQKEQMKEALRTEYEKGRHDALEEMPKWKPAARAYLGDRLPRIDRSLDRLVARVCEREIAYYLKMDDLYKLPKEE